MSKRVLLAAGLLAAAIATPLSAAPVTLDAVVKKIQQQQKTTQTLQAAFRQEKELALLAQPEVSTGTFLFSKPNNVLWSYDAPKRVQMLITSGTMTTYFPDLAKAEQIDVKRFEDRIFKYMGATGAIDELAKYFDFTFTDNPKNASYVLDLLPKNKATARRVRRIKIWIDKTSYIAHKLEYVEGDGDVTRYEFTNIQINKPVPQTRFSLSLPQNVRVEQMKLQ